MITDIRIMNARAAAEMNPHLYGRKTGMIRILSTGSEKDEAYPEIEHREDFFWLREYLFDDINPKDLLEFPDLVLFSDKHAEQILKDFEQIYRDLDLLVVHCREGISRSSAIAIGLKQAFDLPSKFSSFFDSFYRPNEHVYGVFRDTSLKLGREFPRYYLTKLD